MSCFVILPFSMSHACHGAANLNENCSLFTFIFAVLVDVLMRDGVGAMVLFACLREANDGDRWKPVRTGNPRIL